MAVLDHIELLDWQGASHQLGLKDYELKKIELDYQKHSDRKREMFCAWLRTSTNPTYDDVIKALEAVGENAVARSICVIQ